MLKDIDVLVYDVQDVGVRFCDISTVLYAMRACKKYDKTFIILDRQNPYLVILLRVGALQPDYFSLFGLYLFI